MVLGLGFEILLRRAGLVIGLGFGLDNTHLGQQQGELVRRRRRAVPHHRRRRRARRAAPLVIPPGLAGRRAVRRLVLDQGEVTSGRLDQGEVASGRLDTRAALRCCCCCCGGGGVVVCLLGLFGFGFALGFGLG